MSPATARRVVRLTARTSAMLFAGAQVAPLACRRCARVGETLYQAFMAAHVVHFASVTRYTLLTGGHDVFPGGRDLHDVGGWPTVAGIFTGFAGVATIGWVGRPITRVPPGVRTAAGAAARTVIGTLFAGTFASQIARSAWYVVPMVISGVATVLGIVGARRRLR
jgi:hypothetical protein